MSMNLGAALRGVALAAALAVSNSTGAQTPVRGSAEACESWAILAPGGGPAGSLAVCSKLLREVPALREQIERLNKVASRDAETQRDLQRFGLTLNEMARKMKPLDVSALADALALKLRDSGALGDSALVNEVDRLRLSMREMNQKLDQIQSQPALRDRAAETLRGETGQALARLDFEAARQLLDGLRRIEGKIDDAQGPYAANPSLLELVRSEALETYRRAETAGAPTRCARGWTSVRTLLQAAQDTQRQGKLNAAGLTYKELVERAGQVLGELDAVDSVTRMNDEARRRQAGLESQLLAQAFESLGMSFDRRRAAALNQARTPLLRTRLGEADAMRIRATELMRAGKLSEAMDLLVDGFNLLGRIESEGGNYTTPLPDMPKSHRRITQSAMPPVDLAGMFPNGLCR
jgi:hypothetical protein